jgi:hypothetical protein
MRWFTGPLGGTARNQEFLAAIPAITTATTATPIPPTATKSPAAAAPALFFPSFIDHDRPTFEIMTFHPIDSVRRFIIIGHLHETESFGPSSISVLYDAGAGNLPTLAEKLGQLVLGDLVAQIANVEFLGHAYSPFE